jgi:hypothetical protein
LRAVTLPPPAGTILLYAADGLSAKRGDLSPAGRPRTPRRSIWVPLFRDYIETDEGLGTLHSLAKDGMTAWDCSPDQLDSLVDAFADISFRALSVAALEHFAATAHEKVLMPELPKKSVPESPKPAPHDSAKPFIQSTEPRRPTTRSPLHRLTP